jgi:hypothetical protein
MELASYHHYGAYDFEMAPRFSENLGTPVINHNYFK